MKKNVEKMTKLLYNYTMEEKKGSLLIAFCILYISRMTPPGAILSRLLPGGCHA
jgi:hypothetical protein